MIQFSKKIPGIGLFPHSLVSFCSFHPASTSTWFCYSVSIQILWWSKIQKEQVLVYYMLHVYVVHIRSIILTLSCPRTRGLALAIRSQLGHSCALSCSLDFFATWLPLSTQEGENALAGIHHRRSCALAASNYDEGRGKWERMQIEHNV